MSAKEKKKTKQVQDDDPGRQVLKHKTNRSYFFRALSSHNVIEFNQMVKPFGQESYQTILQYVNNNKGENHFYFVSGSYLSGIRQRMSAYYVRRSDSYKKFNIILSTFFFTYIINYIRSNGLNHKDFILLSAISINCLSRGSNKFNSSDITRFCSLYYKTNFSDRYFRLKKLGYIVNDPDWKQNHFIITSRVHSFARSIQNNLALFYNNEIDNIEDI